MKDAGVFRFGVSDPPTAADREWARAHRILGNLIEPPDGIPPVLPPPLTWKRLVAAREELRGLAAQAFHAQTFPSEGAGWRAVERIIAPIDALLAETTDLSAEGVSLLTPAITVPEAEGVST